MRRDEYLQILSDRLRVLPGDEYKDTMEYYTEYFEEAGEENEEAVIRELGDVEELAKRVIQENMGEQHVTYNQTYGQQQMPTPEYAYGQQQMPTPEYAYGQATGQSFNGYGYNSNQPQGAYPINNGQPYYNPYNQPQQQGLSTGWKVVIAIISFPIWGGLVAGVIGLILGLGGAAVGCFIGGMATIVAGFAVLGSSGATCVLAIGSGLLVMAIALGFLMGTIGIAQLVGKAISAIFGKRKQQKYI